MASFTIERKIRRPIEEVWSLLGDFTKSPSPEIKVDVEKEGDPNAGGAGTIRTLTIGRIRVRDVLETANPPHSFTYRIVGGGPIRAYHGRVDLAEEEGSTIVHYHGSLEPRIPFTGGICCRLAKHAVNRLLDAIEKHHT